MSTCDNASRRTTTPTWLGERLERISALGQLPSNWDSYGAARVDARSIARATQLLQGLAEFQAVERPTVTASPDGNVALCWGNGSKSLDIEVLPDGSVAYAFTHKRDSHQGYEWLTRETKPLVDSFAQ